MIGFDGIEEGAFHHPTLSTIRPDKAEIARLALALVERRITAGEAASPQEAYAPFELLARRSTGAA